MFCCNNMSIFSHLWYSFKSFSHYEDDMTTRKTEKVLQIEKPEENILSVIICYRLSSTDIKSNFVRRWQTWDVDTMKFDYSNWLHKLLIIIKMWTECLKKSSIDNGETRLKLLLTKLKLLKEDFNELSPPPPLSAKLLHRKQRKTSINKTPHPRRKISICAVCIWKQLKPFAKFSSQIPNSLATV